METVSISGLTYAVVEALKRSRMPEDFAGIASVIVGVIIAFLYALQDNQNITTGPTIATTLLSGIIAGLIASGFYSTTKAVAERNQYG